MPIWPSYEGCTAFPYQSVPVLRGAPQLIGAAREKAATPGSVRSDARMTD